MNSALLEHCFFLILIAALSKHVKLDNCELLKKYLYSEDFCARILAEELVFRWLLLLNSILKDF